VFEVPPLGVAVVIRLNGPKERRCRSVRELEQDDLRWIADPEGVPRENALTDLKL
jgi:hypothetical protein